MADLGGESTHNCPVFLGVARRECRAARHLRTALGVDVGGTLLRIGRPRQDDIGALCTGIAVTALVDHKDLAQAEHVDLVGSEQVDDVQPA